MSAPLGSPYAPPWAELRESQDSVATVRRRMLLWGAVAGVLLSIFSGLMYFSVGLFEQVFISVGADLPMLVQVALKLRAAWFLLPAAAIVLTVAGVSRRFVFLEPARVTHLLIAMLIASIFLFGFGWYVMLYLPIFPIGKPA